MTDLFYANVAYKAVKNIIKHPFYKFLFKYMSLTKFYC